MKMFDSRFFVSYRSSSLATVPGTAFCPLLQARRNQKMVSFRQLTCKTSIHDFDVC